MKKESNVATNSHCRTWLKRIGAFTLAEVLITLAVIGVVAAMTIPTLVKNYQKQVLVTQLKKSVSTIENGFKKMMADDEVDKLSDTILFQQLGNDDCNSALYTSLDVNDSCKLFIDGLKNYFNIIDIGIISSDYKWNFRDGSGYDDLSNDDFIKLSDGIVLEFFARDSKIETLFIDINGSKGPNVYGRDVFGFDILDNGLLKDNDYAQADCTGPTVSYGCYNKIIQDGWKMNY